MRGAWRILLVCALATSTAVAMSGCGDDDGSGTDGGGGGGDGGPGTDGGPDVDGGPGTDGGPDVDGGGGDTDGGPGGAACVNDLDPACNATEYCDFPDNLCGTGMPGVCRPRPTTCDPSETPSCGCGNPMGLVWPNECSAYMGGKDINNAGTCTPPAETYNCGSRVCRTGMEYCVRSVSDVGGEPDTYDCVTLPGACTGMTDCACFPAATPCVDMCAYADGHFTITCPGG